MLVHVIPVQVARIPVARLHAHGHDRRIDVVLPREHLLVLGLVVLQVGAWVRPLLGSRVIVWDPGRVGGIGFEGDSRVGDGQSIWGWGCLCAQT